MEDGGRRGVRGQCHCYFHSPPLLSHNPSPDAASSPTRDPLSTADPAFGAKKKERKRNETKSEKDLSVEVSSRKQHSTSAICLRRRPHAVPAVARVQAIIKRCVSP